MNYHTLELLCSWARPNGWQNIASALIDSGNRGVLKAVLNQTECPLEESPISPRIAPTSRRRARHRFFR
jgi:hypothetical protein